MINSDWSKIFCFKISRNLIRGDRVFLMLFAGCSHVVVLVFLVLSVIFFVLDFSFVFVSCFLFCFCFLFLFFILFYSFALRSAAFALIVLLARSCPDRVPSVRCA